jgi:hypothetical protein
VSADVESKQAITEAIYRYCRGIDRLTRDIVAPVFHDDATADYGFFQGPASEFLDGVFATHGAWIGHFHNIGNVLIELDGDRAASEAYITAAVWLDTDDGLTEMVSRGRYVDRWSHRQGIWAIDHRQWIDEFTSMRPLPESSRPDPTTRRSRRDRSDPSFGVLGG